MDQTSEKYVSEQELNDKAVAPRVTLEKLEENIAVEYTFRLSDAFGGPSPYAQVPIVPSLKLVTLHVLVLKNGFTVIGQSACVSTKNYDPDTGARVARGDAIRQVWALMGYELRSELAGSISRINQGA